MALPMNRRQFLARAGAVGAAIAGAGPLRLLAADAAEITVPRIKLGRQDFSRIILDYQAFRGHGHRRFLVCKAMFRYFQGHLLDTYAEAGKWGIDTALTSAGGAASQDSARNPAGDPGEVRKAQAEGYGTLAKYAKDGGKVNKLLYEVIMKSVGLESGVGGLAKADPLASYFMGSAHNDGMLQAEFFRLQRLLKAIRDSGKVVAVATAKPSLLAQYEKYRKKRLLEVDYYMLAVCASDEYPQSSRNEAYEALPGVEIPVILRRLMPADAKADEARTVLEEALKHMAPKDGLCLNFFPKDDPDQIKRCARLVADLSAKPT